jgi:hypothetical protein
MKMPRLRPSYANVTSTLALVVALGGTGAYAANTIGSGDIKPGAVKASDLGKNAVSSPKVKDGSLQLNDLDGSARTSASQAQRNGVSPEFDPGTHTVVTLPLKAGQYVLLASTGYQPSNGGKTVICRIRVNNNPVSARFVTNNGVGDLSCSTHTVVKLTQPGSVTLEIEVEAGDSVAVRDPKVTAIRVGSVSAVQVTG